MQHNFKFSEIYKPKPFLTISTNLHLGSEENSATCFSLGANTDISPETYANPIIYFICGGSGHFICDGKKTNDCLEFDAVYVKESTLCGSVAGADGFIYTEIFMDKESKMNELVKSGEVIKLKNLIDYEEGSIANLDIAKNDKMKFVLMAFDKGTGLAPHKAPGNAIVVALEGKATIGYEGKDYTLTEGEAFRFDKDGLHSVKAEGQFKMALILVLE